MSSSTSAQLPKYRCHKEVWALQIAAIQTIYVNDLPTRRRAIVPVLAAYAPIEVDSDWFAKHEPQAGGYLVVYEDGYRSYSPREAFEGGYTRISP